MRSEGAIYNFLNFVIVYMSWALEPVGSFILSCLLAAGTAILSNLQISACKYAGAHLCILVGSTPLSASLEET